MAAAHARKQAPAGSAQWVLDERRQVDDFVAQEVEEFQFSARNDVEWLNEHMADILTRSHLYGDVPHSQRCPVLTYVAMLQRPSRLPASSEARPPALPANAALKFAR